MSEKEVNGDSPHPNDGMSENGIDNTFAAPTFHEFLSATRAQKILVPFIFSLIDFIGGLLFRWFGFQPYKFEEEAVLKQACKTTGFSDFGDSSFREPLRILLKGLEEEAQLTPSGRMVTYNDIQRLLCGRLGLIDTMKMHPDIDEERIEAPVFIVGLPRTGTTILHNLMSQDPANRTAAVWEIHRIHPHPQRSTYNSDPRIKAVQEELQMADALMPTLKVQHEITATGPQECTGFHMYNFMSFTFPSTHYNLPTYWEYFSTHDMTPTYKFMRWQLKYLQWQGLRGARWVCKCPCHIFSLDALLNAFPDAKFVFTHRDPVKVSSSALSLIRTIRQLHTDKVDPAMIAAEWDPRLVDALKKTDEIRDERGLWGDNKAYDMLFNKLVKDPVGEVEKMYKVLGLPISGEAKENMTRFLALNPKDKHGKHEYDSSASKQDDLEKRERYASYIARHNIPEEKTI